MKSIHLITVGKLKDKNLEIIEKQFTKRIKSLSLKIHELRSSSENRDQEAKLIIKKLSEFKAPFVCALTEFGKEFYSPEFSQFLYQKFEQKDELIFIIAGAEGFGQEVLQKCHFQLSLSKLTFPHKLARVIFLEQLYRAITIQENHPYHN